MTCCTGVSGSQMGDMAGDTLMLSMQWENDQLDFLNHAIVRITMPSRPLRDHGPAVTSRTLSVVTSVPRVRASVPESGHGGSCATNQKERIHEPCLNNMGVLKGFRRRRGALRPIFVMAACLFTPLMHPHFSKDQVFPVAMPDSTYSQQSGLGVLP